MQIIRKRLNKYTLVAGLTNVTLLVLIFLDCSRDFSLPESREIADKGINYQDKRRQERNNNTALTIDHYASFIERPLFYPGRHNTFTRTGIEKSTSGQDAGETRQSPEKFRLSAVVKIDEKVIALVDTTTRDRIVRVTPGDTMGDWTVLGIEPNRVKLKRAGKHQTLTLRTENQ